MYNTKNYSFTYKDFKLLTNLMLSFCYAGVAIFFNCVANIYLVYFSMSTIQREGHWTLNKIGTHQTRNNSLASNKINSDWEIK